MSDRKRGLTASVVLIVACITAFLTTAPVSVPHTYSYTVTTTQAQVAVWTVTNSDDIILCEILSGLSCGPGGDITNVTPILVTSTSTGNPITYSQVRVATSTTTGYAPLLFRDLNPSLRVTLIVGLIALAGVLVYGLARSYRKPPRGNVGGL